MMSHICTQRTQLGCSMITHRLAPLLALLALLLAPSSDAAFTGIMGKFASITVTSSATLPAGYTIPYYPALFSRPLVGTLTNAQVVLPPTGDIYGCYNATTNNATLPAIRAKFNGTIILAQTGGGCLLGSKALFAQIAGAAGIMIYQCSPNSPTYCDPTPTVMRGGAATDIPSVSVNYTSGHDLTNAINANDTVLVTWAGNTGTNFDDYNALKAIVNDANPPFQGAGPYTSSNILGPALPLGAAGATQVGAAGVPWWYAFSSASNSNASLFVDPCIGNAITKQYLHGIWCQNNRIVSIFCWACNTNGTLPNGFNQLSALIYLDFQTLNNLTGFSDSPIPFSSLTSLQTLIAPNIKVASVNNHISALPASFGSLPSLRHLALAGNYLPNVNSNFFNLSQLSRVDLSSNNISMVFPLNTFTQLKYLDLSINNINGALPDVSLLQQIQTLTLRQNKYSGSVAASAFDNLPQLTALDLSFNSLTGQLPNCNNTLNLQSLLLSGNKFSGLIPSSYGSLAALRTLQLDQNGGLLSPIPSLNGAVNLLTFDISGNQFTCFDGSATGDFGKQILPKLPPQLQSFSAGNNNLTGTWSTGTSSYLMSLITLKLQNNFITAVPTDMLTSPTMQYVDMSNNNLTGDLTLSPLPSTIIQSLNFSSNPKLHWNGPGTLPAWAAATSSRQLDATQRYSCQGISGTGGRSVNFVVDPTYFSFTYCTCVAGTFGTPPLCIDIPKTVSLTQNATQTALAAGLSNTYQTLTVSASPANKSAYAVADAKLLAALNPQGPGSAITSGYVSGSVFSDAFYGSARKLTGMDTQFLIDTTILNLTTTIRSVYIHFDFNPVNWNGSNDIIQVYQGNSGSTTQDLLVSTVTGSSTVIQRLYGLPGLPSDVIVAFGGVAYISYRSPDPSGEHFVASYWYSSDCPPTYFSHDGVICAQHFQPSTAIASVVYAIVAIGSAYLTVATGFVIYYRNTPVIKSSSFLFSLIILGSSLWLSLSSLLYTTNPGDQPWVCDGRPWFTAMGVVTTMSALLVKTFRIQEIFNQRALKVLRISNMKLILQMTFFLAVQAILLIAYSAGTLQVGGFYPGSGSNAGLMVGQCQEKDSYTIWLGIELGYIFSFCLGGLVLAFKVRNVTSAFNEAPHILIAVSSILLYGIILIPLQFLVNDSPDALTLIRGLGQSLVGLTMGLAMFAPKIFYIVTQKDASRAYTFESHTGNHSALDNGSQLNNTQPMRKGSATNGANGPSSIAGSSNVSSPALGATNPRVLTVPRSNLPPVGAQQHRPSLTIGTPQIKPLTTGQIRTPSANDKAPAANGSWVTG